VCQSRWFFESDQADEEKRHALCGSSQRLRMHARGHRRGAGDKTSRRLKAARQDKRLVVPYHGETYLDSSAT
jgi:hypothetical protein